MTDRSPATALRIAALVALLAASAPSAAAAGDTVTLSIVGTSDLHGHLEALPIFGGYLANLRKARRADRGAVVLVDAGDMFQGTLESNLGEGAAVIRAYNSLRYDAAAIGNHEFDFGPIGPAATPQSDRDDPQGALKARASEARFPFLAANVTVAATGQPIDWPNVTPSAIVRRAGLRLGLIGVTTESTPQSTIASNLRGLVVTELAAAIVREATQLRRSRVDLVLVIAHAGGSCTRWNDPNELGSCTAGSEIFQVARRLPTGLVDAIVGGHTHAAVAHEVAGIPIVQSHANGRAFGRIDLLIDRATRRVKERRIFPPQRLDAGGSYEGAAVALAPAITARIAPDVERSRALRNQPLGTATMVGKIRRAYGEESALGNLFADLMRAARPKADVAMTNGGGLRADLPSGPLTYGSLFEAYPFDNRFALVNLSGAALSRLLAANLAHGGGILSLSGVRANARCQAGALVVALERDDGRPVRPDETLTVVTSDFLVTGGDGLFVGEGIGAAQIEEGAPLREALADLLRQRGGTVRADDASLFSRHNPRVRFPSRRPVRCR